MKKFRYIFFQTKFTRLYTFYVLLSHLTSLTSLQVTLYFTRTKQPNSPQKQNAKLASTVTSPSAGVFTSSLVDRFTSSSSANKICTDSDYEDSESEGSDSDDDVMPMTMASVWQDSNLVLINCKTILGPFLLSLTRDGSNRFERSVLNTSC